MYRRGELQRQTSTYEVSLTGRTTKSFSGGDGCPHGRDIIIESEIFISVLPARASQIINSLFGAASRVSTNRVAVLRMNSVKAMTGARAATRTRPYRGADHGSFVLAIGGFFLLGLGASQASYAITKARNGRSMGVVQSYSIIEAYEPIRTRRRARRFNVAIICQHPGSTLRSQYPDDVA